MRQLLLLILLIFVGRWLAKMIRAVEAARASAANAGAAAGGGTRAGGSPFGSRSAGAAPSLAEPVVRCAACGVHAPKSESLFAEGQYFCCAEHARRHTARATGSR